MAIIRKVALGFMLTAALAVVVLAVFLLWDYRHWDSFVPDGANALDLQNHLDTLTRRVRDMELLVVVLLASSGLYAFVFAATSYFSAMSFARQADRSVARIQDQLGAVVDLRSHAVGLESQVSAIGQQIAGWNSGKLDGQSKLELLHWEHATAYLELAGGPQLGARLANVYRGFASFYKASDPTRARFYLDRALVLSPPGLDLTSGIHYDLACWFAGNREFEEAVHELEVAFQRQSKVLEDRLARDIEEGGELCELASTSPFDKAVNDVLLNVVL